MSDPQLPPAAPIDPPRPGRAALIAAALMLLTLLPYLLGRAWAGPDEVFMWTRPANVTDPQNNLAWIERARAGEAPLQNPFQPRSGTGVWRPTYQLLGGLARATGLSGVAVFQLGRLGGGVLFLLAFYRLAARLFPRERERWWAWTLCAGGSGLSWLTWILAPDRPGAGWGDVGQVELTVSSSLLESPHLLVALWLQVEALLALLDAARAPADAPVVGPALRAALAAAPLVLIQPFQVPGLVLAGVWIALLARGPACGPRRLVGVGAGLGIALALPALDLALRLRSDASFSSWSQRMETVGPGYLLLGLAPLWLLAALGAGHGLEEHALEGLGEAGPSAGSRQALRRRTWWLVAWSLGFWALVLLPLPQQRRLATGWVLPLALLGAQGVAALRARWPGRLTAPLAIGLACAGSLNLVAVQLWEYRQDAARGKHYLPRGLVEVLRGLRARLGPDDVALADWSTSGWIPALAGCRTIHGHPYQGTAPPERIEAAADELQRAAREGHPPRFAGELERVRAVVLLRGPDGLLRARLDRARLDEGRLELVWEGPTPWAPPALETDAAALVLIPAR